MMERAADDQAQAVQSAAEELEVYCDSAGPCGSMRVHAGPCGSMRVHAGPMGEHMRNCSNLRPS